MERVHIPKDQLIAGEYYEGHCRNASLARWDGRVFHHWRTKFGSKFIERINCPEDEQHFDVFYATRHTKEPSEKIRWYHEKPTPKQDDGDNGEPMSIRGLSSGMSSLPDFSGDGGDSGGGGASGDF